MLFNTCNASLWFFFVLNQQGLCKNTCTKAVLMTWELNTQQAPRYSKAGVDPGGIAGGIQHYPSYFIFKYKYV